MQKIPVEPAVYGVQFHEDKYYHGSFPCFYNSEEFEEIKMVEAQWEIMRDEIMEYLNSGKALTGSTSPNSPGLSHPDAWKRMYFMNSLWLHPSNCRKLPKTWKILRQIPGVTLGAVLILDPRSRIMPHSSESNINIRCHLGIKIPGELPTCGMQVGSEQRGWKEGKVIMFSDCHEHTVWNDTDENRIIVAFDILHKQYMPKKTWLSAKYLGALTLRALNTVFPFRTKIPGGVLKVLHNGLSGIWFFYVLFQAKLEPVFTRQK